MFLIDYLTISFISLLTLSEVVVLLRMVAINQLLFIIVHLQWLVFKPKFSNADLSLNSRMRFIINDLNIIIFKIEDAAYARIKLKFWQWHRFAT